MDGWMVHKGKIRKLYWSVLLGPIYIYIYRRVTSTGRLHERWWRHRLVQESYN
jgi:hypothetical protein